MSEALIGHTGFVGSTLLRARDFDACFNSRTIADIAGRAFDTVICAGVSAVKWLANKEPAADKASIAVLTRYLETVRAGHFLLISTVDVYRDPTGVTEDDEPPTQGLHPYGLHRLQLERFVVERFPRSTIVRLPGLFGTGLRKNLIFDLLHRHQTERIVPNGELQWYPLRRLAGDLERIAAAGHPTINVAVPPIATSAIRDRFFPDIAIGEAATCPPRYDMRTRHANVLGSVGDYHLTTDDVVRELDGFVGAERGTG